MSAGRKDEHLLRIVRELYTELGYSDADGRPCESWLRYEPDVDWAVCDGDLALIPRLREELARLAFAANGDGERRAVRSALDGVELVMRAEVAAQRPEMLATHLPGFAFIVTFPGLGRERAIELSRRAEQLLRRDFSE